MRFLTPAEQRLIDSLPPSEAEVLRAFFEWTDARLVDDGPTPPAGVQVLQVPLFGDA